MIRSFGAGPRPSTDGSAMYSSSRGPCDRLQFGTVDHAPVVLRRSAAGGWSSRRCDRWAIPRCRDSKCSSGSIIVDPAVSSSTILSAGLSTASSIVWLPMMPPQTRGRSPPEMRKAAPESCRGAEKVSSQHPGAPGSCGGVAEECPYKAVRLAVATTGPRACSSKQWPHLPGRTTARAGWGSARSSAAGGSPGNQRCGRRGPSHARG